MVHRRRIEFLRCRGASLRQGRLVPRVRGADPLASRGLNCNQADEIDELGDGPRAADRDEQRVERRLEEVVVSVEKGGQHRQVGAFDDVGRRADQGIQPVGIWGDRLYPLVTDRQRAIDSAVSCHRVDRTGADDDTWGSSTMRHRNLLLSTLRTSYPYQTKPFSTVASLTKIHDVGEDCKTSMPIWSSRDLASRLRMPYGTADST